MFIKFLQSDLSSVSTWNDENETVDFGSQEGIKMINDNKTELFKIEPVIQLMKALI